MSAAELPAWAQHLGLQRHPEGGWYAETYRHPDLAITEPSRALATAIYFLLLPGEAPGAPEAKRLGSRIEDGQLPQLLVPAGHWQAARPADDEPVLVSCVVSPGFDFADFTLHPAALPE